MSAFNVRNIREIATDPLSKFTNEIAKKLSRFLTKDQLDQLADKEDIYINGIDFDTVIRFHDELLSTKTFDFNTQYLPPFEPDRDKLRCWLRGYNLGNAEKDWSSFNRTCDVLGDPILIDGTPFDLGIHTGGVKSICMRFNRPTSEFINEEYIRIENGTSTTLDIDNAGTPGKSYFMRFRMKSLAHEGGSILRLWEKTDDSTPNNGIQVKVESDGRLIVVIKDNGVEVKKETAGGSVVVDTIYDLWVTYTIAGNAIKVYLNNVDMTLVNNVDATNWHSDLSDIDIFVFRRGLGDPTGHVYGDFYDFRIYDGKVVSATEVGYMNTNKWTIVNIALGAVLISDYSATYLVITPSYTSTSFSSTSFDI